MFRSKNFNNSPTNRRRIFNHIFLDKPLKENPVFTDIKTMLFILKAIGLLPIFEKVSYYEIAPPRRSNAFYSFFVRGLIHALTIFQLYKLLSRGSSEWFFSQRPSDIRNKWIEIILNTISYSATVFICGKSAQTFLKIINDILEVDREIRNKYRVTINNDCEFSKKFLLFICFCLTYIFGLKIVTEYYRLNPTALISITFLVIKNGLLTIFIVFASALLRIITMRFTFLNWILTGYTYKLQRGTRCPMRILGDVRPMKKFPEDSLFTFRMHNKLLCIIAAVSDYCSFIIMSYMGSASYAITFNTYNFLIRFTTQRSFSVEVLQWMLIWNFLHISLLALLSRGCGQVAREINTITQILARVYCDNKEYQKIIIKYLSKNIKQEFQFSAHGFFVIDNSTIFEIFLAVVTFLIIMIQFEQLEDSIMEHQANMQ